MSKKLSGFLLFLILIFAAIGAIFGAAFRLHSQDVTILGHDSVDVSKEDIIKAANIKNGQFIFMVDKNEAMNNIEAAYPNFKVVQIKTTGVTEINICIRVRHKMYFSETDDKYFILDEDLKVLDIIEKIQDENRPQNLIYVSNDILKLDEQTQICDFVQDEHAKAVCSGIYQAMTTTVTKQEYGETEYINRKDIKNIIKSVEFYNDYETFNKIIITTKYGVKLDIENPTRDLQNKINICFSLINTFIGEESNKEKSGTIKIFYDLNNSQKCVYIP